MEYEEMEKSKWILPTFPSRENQCQRPRLLSSAEPLILASSGTNIQVARQIAWREPLRRRVAPGQNHVQMNFYIPQY